MQHCLFCDIQQGVTPPTGGPIYEDDLIYAHHAHFDDGPAYLGSLAIETKRHTPRLCRPDARRGPGYRAAHCAPQPRSQSLHGR